MGSFFPYISKNVEYWEEKKIKIILIKTTQLSQHHHVKVGVVAKNSFRIKAQKDPISISQKKISLPRFGKRLGFSKGSNFTHAHEWIDLNPRFGGGLLTPKPYRFSQVYWFRHVLDFSFCRSFNSCFFFFGLESLKIIVMAA